MRDQAATPENGPLAGRAGGRGRSSVGREGTTERVNPEPGCGCCHDGRPPARPPTPGQPQLERTSERERASSSMASCLRCATCAPAQPSTQPPLLWCRSAWETSEATHCFGLGFSRRFFSDIFLGALKLSLA